MGKTGGVTGRSTPHVTTFILSRHCGSRPLLEFPTTTIWVGTLSGESYVLVSPMCCVLVEAGVMDGIAESQNSHVDRSSWFSDFSVPGNPFRAAAGRAHRSPECFHRASARARHRDSTPAKRPKGLSYGAHL